MNHDDVEMTEADNEPYTEHYLPKHESLETGDVAVYTA